MLVEFGAFKRKWFNYLDSNVCHHLALASGDHYTQIIQKADPDARLLVLAGQPTTEHLARFLFTKAKKILSTLRKDASVLQVDLRETERNMASYSESA